MHELCVDRVRRRGKETSKNIKTSIDIDDRDRKSGVKERSLRRRCIHLDCQCRDRIK